MLASGMHADGGIQRFNRTLVAALEILGCDLRVLSLSDALRQNPDQAKTRVDCFGGNRARFALATVKAVASGRFDYIVVGHINFLSLVLRVQTLCLRQRARVLMVAHGIEVWYGLKKSTRRDLSRLWTVLCVSRYTRDALLQQAPELYPNRLQVFPNALSDRWSELNTTLRPLILPARFILSVSRLESTERYKGIVSVIESLAMVNDTTLHYLVVGRGGDADFLQRVAKRCGVQQRVHFLGSADDAELVSLYGRCQAFVLPSANEGFGIVYLEAMFFGAPVIAAAAKGALDVVRDGETGLMVRFGDTAGLKCAIDRLGEDEALRDRLRVRGRASVTGSGEFSFKRFIARSALIFYAAGS